MKTTAELEAMALGIAQTIVADHGADEIITEQVAAAILPALEELNEATAAARSSGDMWETDFRALCSELGVPVALDSVDSAVDEAIEVIQRRLKLPPNNPNTRAHDER